MGFPPKKYNCLPSPLSLFTPAPSFKSIGVPVRFFVRFLKVDWFVLQLLSGGVFNNDNRQLFFMLFSTIDSRYVFPKTLNFYSDLGLL